MTRLDEACKRLGRVTSRVAHWIDRQPSVGEESITDWLLFEISERLPWVRYRKFTRHEESRQTGADWEWWLVSRRAALGLRVQAKRVVSNADHYRALAYTSRTGLQIELLIEAARRANLLPFYALYHSPVGTPGVKCGGKNEAGKGEGVFIADAASLYGRFIKPGRSKVEDADLVAMSNPLSCLFCCPLGVRHEPDPVAGVYYWIDHYFGDGIRESANSNVNRPGLVEQPPEYVRLLIEHDADRLPDWWEQEFSASIRDAHALLVFDLRET